MFRYKKTITICCLFFSLFSISMYAQLLQRVEVKYTNLQVLPKNISKEALDKQMDFYCVSLNVKCAYCHAPSLTSPGKLDFAADSLAGHKEDGRRMLKLTQEINAKYFGATEREDDFLKAINCYSCHRGEEYPTVDVSELMKKNAINSLMKSKQ